MTSVLTWIRDHDDRLSFVILYIGGAIALSIWLNLFWVVMLMLGHFGLEIFRGRLLGVTRPLAHAVWEVKLDIALMLFALVVALYADHILGLLGLGQAARAGQAARGLQAATRFGIIERALRVAVLTSDDILRLVQAAIRFRGRNGGPAIPAAARHEAETMAATAPALDTGDVLTLSFGALCLLLIALVPTLTGMPPAEVAQQILYEISPGR